MKPTRAPIKDKQIDLFRPELSKIIDPRHSLVKLSKVVNWDDLEIHLEKHFVMTMADPENQPA